MKVIGITGTLGAGKGTITEYLVREKGFTQYSARELILEEVARRGLPPNRDSTTLVANALRTERSPSYIAEALYERAEAGDTDAVIESLRAPREVEALHEKGDFTLFAVDADPHIRYQRIVKRGSSLDDISFEKFLSDEKREYESDDPTKQNLKRCIEMADFLFENSGTLEELHAQIENAFTRLKK